MNVCKDDASILIIYTGGTIGMIENPETGSLEAFNFEHSAWDRYDGLYRFRFELYAGKSE